ncbi:hypothetical protein [Sulfuracidifex tepidarius]|uniref:Cytochrome b558/566 subunit B n=1 Tax=Sulfuracidifex tepidarius TaxID=1294262 RepID=A0A510E556_9CREN|nr:hypothetical protein [Sulfuracidifex tepidarius]BBG27636.1 hypothetical protein IC007_2190 [Sulfuracidifex tepidarius]
MKVEIKSLVSEKDLKWYTVFLFVAFFLQFFYQVIFPISYLPLSIPGKITLEYLGTAGIYLGYGASFLIAIAMSGKIKSLIPLAVVDVLSPVFNHSLPFTILGIAVSIVVIVESFLRRKGLDTLFLLPTLALISFSMISAVTIDSLNFTFNPGYTYMFLLSVVTFAFFTFWGKQSKKDVIKYLVSIPSLFLFLPLYFLVESNRFMFMIMDMTFSAIYGISFNDPNNLGLFLLLLSISTYLSLVTALRRNGMAGLGYFMVISDVFMGITGFHLMEYIFLVAMGFSMITYKDTAREKGREALSKTMEVHDSSSIH